MDKYKKWWLGLELPQGKIVDVFYPGNSVYGYTYVKINNQWYRVHQGSNSLQKQLNRIYINLLN